MISHELDKTTAEKVKNATEKKNCQMLFVTAAICAGLFLGMLLSSFISSSTEQMVELRMRSRYIYAVLFAVCTLISALSKYKPEKYSKHIIIIWYLFLSILYAFAIWAGTYNQNYYPAVTFFVFLFALPLLIVDRPFRLTTYLIAVSGIFLFCSWQVKEPALFELDLLNCICFFYLSVSFSIAMMKSKLNEILQKIEIEAQRDIDPLTGIMNKGAIEREIEKALNNKETGCLVIIDIDNFKLINDNYGHLFGDAVIRAFANYFCEMFMENALTGRFGGDEFVAFLKGVKSQEDLERLFQPIQENLKKMLGNQEQKLPFTISAGAVFYHGNEMAYDSLLMLADQALYQAKRAGKNQLKILEHV